MKKGLFIVTVGILLFGVLSLGVFAEGQKEQDGGGKQGLSVWWAQPIFPSEEALIKQYVSDYSTQSGVEVDFEIWPHQEVNDKLGPAVASGTTPDILWHVHQMYVAPLAERGLMMDVSGIIDDLGRDRFVSGVLNIASLGDFAYCVPYYIYSTWLHYRMDMFSDAGYDTPPADWPGFIDACEKINDPDNDLWSFALPLGEAAQYDAHSSIVTIINSFGGQEVTKDGKKPAINSPGTIEAVKVIEEAWDKNLIPKGSAAWTAWDNNQFYQSGKTAVTSNPTGSILAWSRQNDQELYSKSRTVKWPKGTMDNHYTQLGQYGFYVFKDIGNVEAGKAFIKSFYDEEKYMALAKEIPPYFFPIYTDLLQDDFYQQEVQLAQLVEHLLSPNVMKVEPGYPYGYNAGVGDAWTMNVYPHMVLRVVLGDWTPEEAVKEAQTRMEGAFGRYYK